ncbi:MAG TPA: hypothetical protein VKU60_06645 [Chloroflexota bacterium]|nr:hypothetical protein [Chloroflexota bacterium]
MLGLSPENSSLLPLVLLSAMAFLVAARAPRLTGGRAAVIYSVGFSLAFLALAFLSGLTALRP